MMSLLLSSVSASAIIAGGGGGYPSAAEATEIYTATDHVNQFFSEDYAVTVDGLGGSYIVAFFGGWGGTSDSDGSDVECTCAEANTVTKFHTSEDSYDVVIWTMVNMPAGPVTMNLSFAGVAGTVFRTGVTVWKLNAASTNPNEFLLFTQNNQSSNSTVFTPISANGLILGVAHTNTSDAHTWSGTPTLHVNENIGSEGFWWSSVSYTGVPGTEQTITTTEPSAVTRELQSVVWIPYEAELQSQSINLSASWVYSLGGSSRNLAIRNQPTYILANNAGADRLHVNNVTTYFLAVP